MKVIIKSSYNFRLYCKCLAEKFVFNSWPAAITSVIFQEQKTNEVESRIPSLIGLVLIKCMCWEYFTHQYKLQNSQHKPQNLRNPLWVVLEKGLFPINNKQQKKISEILRKKRCVYFNLPNQWLFMVVNAFLSCSHTCKYAYRHTHKCAVQYTIVTACLWAGQIKSDGQRHLKLHNLYTSMKI